MAAMSTDVAIRIDEVSKAYRVYRRMSDLLREGVFGGERQLSARPGLNWLDFGLRLRLGFLAF